MKLITNFFWRGDDFQFLNRLTVLSHLVVDHGVKIWLSGPKPKSKYWINDISDIEIGDADKIANTKDFIRERGANLRTASSLFRFTYLYEYGGLYCDTDIIALKKFPDDEWILATHHDDVISNSIIKAPPKQEVFKYCIDNIRPKWGNVWVLTKACEEYELKKTHPNSDFYPWGCKSGSRLLDSTIKPDGYGLHFYFNSACNLGINHNTYKKYNNSLLEKLQKWVFKDYSEVNNG